MQGYMIPAGSDIKYSSCIIGVLDPSAHLRLPVHLSTSRNKHRMINYKLNPLLAYFTRGSIIVFYLCYVTYTITLISYSIW